MADNLPPVPYKTPMLRPDGALTEPWAVWFRELRAVIAPGGGAGGVTFPITIPQGGTGHTSPVPAFNALSPLTSKGDVLANDGTDDVRVGVGSNGQVLTADSTQTPGVKWADVVSTLTTKGDILSNDGSNNVRVPVGSNGKVLTADSTQSAGVKWATPTGGGGGGGTSVTMSVGATAGVSVTSGSPILFDTVAFDSNSAYNAANGKFTAPESGTYVILTSLYAGGALDYQIYKNGSTYVNANSASLAAQGLGLTLISLIAGDYVTVVPGGSTTLTAGVVSNFFCAAKVTASSGTAPKVTVYSSGSGTHSLTGAPVYVEIEAYGGGGGGQGDTGNGGDGVDTTFGTCTAGLGGGGGLTGDGRGLGGTATVGSGWSDIGSSDGMNAGPVAYGSLASGAMGGFTARGGAGTGANGAAGMNATAGLDGTGSGGGGGSGPFAGTVGAFNTSFMGGGAGAMVRAIASPPLSSYAYAVGDGGAAGTGSSATKAGAAGGKGLIIVKEYY